MDARSLCQLSMKKQRQALLPKQKQHGKNDCEHNSKAGDLLHSDSKNAAP
jgi:hypothetical protein